METRNASVSPIGPLALSLGLVIAAASTGCRPTTHAAAPTSMGAPTRTSALEAVMDVPGPVTVETVVGADWKVDQAGLLNLDDPKAKAAGLKSEPVPVQVVFHALRHPTRGLYLVDTGVERAMRDAPRQAAVRGIVASVMHLEWMTFRTDTKTWLDAQGGPPQGVFLTHLHIDHVSGMRDVPAGTPVYVGAGETRDLDPLHVFVSPIVDDALSGKATLQEWRFAGDPDGAFAGVVDVLGDQSVFAISVPGHTPGSTAYLARTPSGPVLMVGDACHTAWGWENGVEPGSFSSDRPKSRESLDRLRAFAARHPALDVRLGHQPLPRRDAPADARQAAH